MKAEALEIGCLGLEEADRFNWCLAPGVEYFERDLLPGPSWEIATAEPFEGDLKLYDEHDVVIDVEGFTNIAQKILNMRPTDVTQQEDRDACSNPVLCSFRNDGAAAFYLVDRSGRHVHLTTMIIHVVYRARYKLSPFQFRSYIDHCKGNQLYTAAIASVEYGSMKGDLVVHHDGTAARVSFVPSLQKVTET